MKWNKRTMKTHRWFAWFPVEMNDEYTIVWLEWVEAIPYEWGDWKYKFIS